MSLQEKAHMHRKEGRVEPGSRSHVTAGCRLSAEAERGPGRIRFYPSALGRVSALLTP